MILFGLIIATLLLVNQNISNSSQGGAPNNLSPEELIQPSDQNQDEASQRNLPPTLFVGITENNTTKVEARKVNEPARLLFTDADETLKVQTLLGLAGDLIYATISDGTQTRLATISTDEQGVFTLQSQEISSTSPPAISPDGQKIASISFNNDERDFGFNLFAGTLGGQATLIDQNSTGLTLPVWDQTSTRLAYISGQATDENGQAIKTYFEDKIQTTTSFAKDSVATDLVWLNATSLLAVLEPVNRDGQNQAKIVLVDLNTGAYGDFANLPGKERSLRTTEIDQFTAVISNEVTNNPATLGEVNILDGSGRQIQTLGRATYIIGWARGEK